MKKHRGVLEGYWETGTEGVCWMMIIPCGPVRRLGYAVARFLPALLAAIREAYRNKKRRQPNFRVGPYLRWRLGSLWSPYNDLVSIDEGDHVLVTIDEGDRLKVFNPDGSVAFDGVIVCDHEAGYLPYPGNPEHGQPCALGMWIHWTQKGWQPDEWARMFLRPQLLPEYGGGKALKATLTKSKVRPEP